MQNIMSKSESLRSQEWVPFATQQQRLRNLIQILGFNLQSDSKYKTLFYYTLHLTTMCAPLYTSEKICDRNPKWAKVNISSSIGSAKTVVIRLWKTANNQTNILFVWAIELSGLLYIPPTRLTSNMFHTNSLVFCMTGGYFTTSHCLSEDQPTLARITDLTLPAKDVRTSGTLQQLLGMHNIQRLTSKKREAANLLKDKISQGEIDWNENSATHQSATIRKLMSKESFPKPSRQSILEKKKEIELLKSRVLLLSQEKARKIATIRYKTELSKTLYEQNTVLNSKLTELNKTLSNDINNLNELKPIVSKSSETLCVLNKQLSCRRKELISELNFIYPITEIIGNISICNIHLPDSENLDGCSDIQLDVGFGYVAHLVQMTSNFMNIPLRYPINYFGSRSKIIDHITFDMQDGDRIFPLFGRSKTRLEFNYGVYLLNKNIAQLRWYNGYVTNDLRTTLLNCLVFVQPRSSFLKLHSSRLSSSNTSLESSPDIPPRFLEFPNTNNGSKMKHSLSQPLLFENKPNDSHSDVHHSS